MYGNLKKSDSLTRTQNTDLPQLAHLWRRGAEDSLASVFELAGCAHAPTSRGIWYGGSPGRFDSRFGTQIQRLTVCNQPSPFPGKPMQGCTRSVGSVSDKVRYVGIGKGSLRGRAPHKLRERGSGGEGGSPLPQQAGEGGAGGRAAALPPASSKTDFVT